MIHYNTTTYSITTIYSSITDYQYTIYSGIEDKIYIRYRIIYGNVAGATNGGGSPAPAVSGL